MRNLCCLKAVYARFLVASAPRAAPDDDAAEGSTSHVNGRQEDGANGEEEKTFTGPQRGKKWSKEERKNKRGANKGRRFQKVRDDLELCWKVASGTQCEFGQE